MPWVRTGETDSLWWRVRGAWRQLDRRLGGSARRRVALAFSASLIVAAIVLVVH